MNLLAREQLKMKRKRGTIPMWAWNALVDVVYAFAITSVEGGRLRRGVGFGSSLVINPALGGGGAGSECVLGSYVEDPNIPGNVILKKGWLIAPNKSVLIKPSSMTPIAGSSVWIKCPWTGKQIDSVLVGGGDLGTPVVAGGVTIPDNTMPASGDLAGKFVYVVLGGWDNDLKWVKTGCGTITLDFCPGGYIIKRGAEAPEVEAPVVEPDPPVDPV